MIKISNALLIGLLVAAPISLAQSQKKVSLAEASENVRLNTKGKILSAKTTQSNGQKNHKIQVLTPSGRVKTFRVPVNKNNRNSRNNARLRKPAPVNRNHQRAPSNLNRAQQRISNPRSRTQTSRSAVIENSEKK